MNAFFLLIPVALVVVAGALGCSYAVEWVFDYQKNRRQKSDRRMANDQRGIDRRMNSTHWLREERRTLQRRGDERRIIDRRIQPDAA